MDQSFFSYSFVDDPTIVLYVGEARREFRIHRKLICDASPFFASAFLGATAFVERSSQSMAIPEDELETVTRFAQWLYRGDFKLEQIAPAESVRAPKPANYPTTEKRYMQLAKLYVFADKYDVVQLQNLIIDKLFEMKLKQLKSPQMGLAAFIYNNTNAGSSFRKLVVGHYVWHVDLQWYFEGTTSEVLMRIPELAADLAIGFAGRVHGKNKSPFEGPSSALYATPKPRTEVVEGQSGDGQPSNGANPTEE